MSETTDQIFVILQHWIVGYAPAGLRPILSTVLAVVGILGVFASSVCDDHCSRTQGAGVAFRTAMVRIA